MLLRQFRNSHRFPQCRKLRLRRPRLGWLLCLGLHQRRRWKPIGQDLKLTLSRWHWPPLIRPLHVTGILLAGLLSVCLSSLPMSVLGPAPQWRVRVRGHTPPSPHACTLGSWLRAFLLGRVYGSGVHAAVGRVAFDRPLQQAAHVSGSSVACAGCQSQVR
jgi:hypothetical protein